MDRPRRTRWEDGASCADEDPEIWFEIENAVDENRVADPMLVSAAIHICGDCPISDRCFHEAVYTHSLGIWGGTTAAERGLKYRLNTVGGTWRKRSRPKGGTS